jgi:hypothetical protein
MQSSNDSSSTSNYSCASCGQRGHQRRIHRDCPLNPNNVSAPDVQQDAMDVDHEASEMDVDLPLANIPRARCICGSNTHSRRTHRNCPLNNNPGNGQRNNQYLNIARQIEQLPERHFLGEMI